MIYNLVPYFTAMVHDAKNGTFKPGKAYTFGSLTRRVPKLNPSYAVAKIPASSMAAMQKASRPSRRGSSPSPISAPDTPGVRAATERRAPLAVLAGIAGRCAPT